MNTIGAFAAKTHFSEILRDVENGKKIAITRRGKTVAIIIPADQQSTYSVEEVFNRMNKLKQQVSKHKTSLSDIKTMKESGRS